MRIAFIGFGEVGSILARDLRAAGQDVVAAFDIAFADPGSRAARNLQAQGVARAASAAEAASGAEVVFCCVTAGSVRPSFWRHSAVQKSVRGGSSALR